MQNNIITRRTSKRESVLLEIFLPSRDARLHHWVHIVRNGSKRRDSLATAAAQGDLKDVPRNRDVPGGRDSDFREEDWFSPLMQARFVAPRGSDRARRTTLARASLIIISGRFLDLKENLSRTLSPFLALFPSFPALSLSFSCARARARRLTERGSRKQSFACLSKF